MQRKNDSFGITRGGSAISYYGITAVRCIGAIRLMPTRAGSCIVHKSKVLPVQRCDQSTCTTHSVQCSEPRSCAALRDVLHAICRSDEHFSGSTSYPSRPEAHYSRTGI